MRRAPHHRRAQAREREARERSHQEYLASLERLKNITQEEVDAYLASIKPQEKP